MATIVLFSFIAGGIAALLTYISDSLSGEVRIGGIITETIFSFLLGFFFEAIYLFWGMPPFVHWTSEGVAVSLLITVVISLTVVFLGAFARDKGRALAINAVIVLVVLGVFFTASLMRHPYPLVFLDNETYDQLAGLLQIREATEEDLAARATDNDLLRITPRAAFLEAQGKMPGTIGTYAGINSSFEQEYNGQRVYVTDLKIDNWRGFREDGGALPGYIIRSATDESAPSQFVDGYSLSYVPDAKWLQDLDRHVYFNYVQNCGCIIDNLDTLEIGDDGYPWYTATAYRATVGHSGWQPFEVIKVDPADGSITRYSLEEAPEWIDRIYSMDMAYMLVDWWANYHAWDAHFVGSNNDRLRIDSAEDVYGPGGRLYYSFTITSYGEDQTLISQIQFDPRTGEAVLFPFPEGIKTRDAVDDLIDGVTASRLNNTVGAEPMECELQNLLGTETWYCILESRGEASGSIAGYAFLQASQASSEQAVVAATTFNEAWDMYRHWIATSGNNEDIELQVAEGNAIVFQGQVLVKGEPAVNNSVMLLVANQEYPGGLYFRVPLSEDQITLTQPGNQVEIVAIELVVTNVMDVSDFTNLDLPALNE